MTDLESSSGQAVRKALRKTPPGPQGYLLFGSSLEVQQRPLTFYYNAWKEYGDVVRFRAIPGFSWYMATHPTAVEHILQSHQRYGKPDVFKKPVSLLVGNGILTSEGEVWLKHRRLMTPAFHRQRLTHLSSLMVNCTESLLQEWQRKTDGEVVDISTEMMRLTLKIVGLALFSTDISLEASAIGSALRQAFEHVNFKMNHLVTIPEWVPTNRNRRFRKAKQTLDNVVLEIINTRRQNGASTNDLLSMLMSVQDEETGQGLSDQELRDEVITLLVAGHDTVGSALSWTWYLLGQHPDVEANLQSELKLILNGRSPTFEELLKLQYTKMIFEESLRLYPPAWGQPRLAKEEDEIQGYFIPKGSLVTLYQYITHRHPEFWDEPETFNPENFTPDKVNTRPNFAYFPFGGGSRICIGKNFALMEGQLVLATIAQRFRLELLPNQIVEADPTFTLRPKNRIKVKLWKRQ